LNLDNIFLGPTFLPLLIYLDGFVATGCGNALTSPIEAHIVDYDIGRKFSNNINAILLNHFE
jgi:hypothetical protein